MSECDHLLADSRDIRIAIQEAIAESPVEFRIRIHFGDQRKAIDEFICRSQGLGNLETDHTHRVNEADIFWRKTNVCPGIQ